MAAKKKILKKVEKQIIELLSNGNTMTFICDALDISRTTEWKHRKDPKNEEYKKALEDALTHRIEIVEDSLYMKAIAGDVQAIKFFLTNRSSKQWQNETFHRMTGEDGDSPIEHDVTVTEMIVEIPESAITDDDIPKED